MALVDVLRAGEFVAELGIQPGLQRGAGARGRAPGRGRRLPRARGRELSRPRQRVGAGAQRIGRAADGHAGRAAARRSATSSRAAASCPAASSASRTRSSSGRASLSVVVEIVVVTDGDVAGDAAGGPGEDRAAARDRSRCTAKSPMPPAPRDDPAGRMAGTLADPHVAHRGARRRLSRALLPGGGEPLNALNLNIVNLIFLLSASCCTARRRA